jgi:serine/threonine protein kinase
MLFGFCPFEEKSIAKLLTLLEEGTVTFPRNINNISMKMEELLRKMLVKDHFKRISWDELFEYELNSNNELVNRR